MVEYTYNINNIFYCLSDDTRRDILDRLSSARLTVSEIAEPYDISLAAISKHLKILEAAKLIVKKKRGKERVVSLAPWALRDASEYLSKYESLWIDRFDRLDNLLQEGGEYGQDKSN